MNINDLTNDRLLEDAGVPIITCQHFVYTSGMHGDGYANLRPLAQPENLPTLQELSYRLVVRAIEEARLELSRQIVVVGPETLGARIAEEGVKAFNQRVPQGIPRLRAGIFVRDPLDRKVYHWGSNAESVMGQGAQVIWVDDLLNQGSTFEITRHLIEETWPKAIRAIATIVDRSKGDTRTFGVPTLVNLLELSLQTYPSTECPLCEKNMPIVRRPGHGHAFEQKHPDYKGGYVD